MFLALWACRFLFFRFIISAFCFLPYKFGAFCFLLSELDLSDAKFKHYKSEILYLISLNRRQEVVNERSCVPEAFDFIGHKS